MSLPTSLPNIFVLILLGYLGHKRACFSRRIELQARAPNLISSGQDLERVSRLSVHTKTTTHQPHLLMTSSICPCFSPVPLHRIARLFCEGAYPLCKCRVFRMRCFRVTIVIRSLCTPIPVAMLKVFVAGVIVIVIVIVMR